MCGFAGMAAATIGLKGLQIRQQNIANAQAYQAQANDAIYQMNGSLVNYEQERQDAYDEAVTSIMKTQQNALQLNSQVQAAVNEDMTGGGRTADQIMRSTVGDTARNIASIQDNYLRKSNEIDLNKLNTLKSTQRTVASYKEAVKPNKKADILSLMGAGLQAYDAYQNVKINRKTGGQK